MKKYSVAVTLTRKYTVDVEAADEDAAIQAAIAEESSACHSNDDIDAEVTEYLAEKD